MPLAQVFGFPLARGEDFRRASFSARRRQRSAYSSFNCSRQNSPIMLTIVCAALEALSLSICFLVAGRSGDRGFTRDLGFGIAVSIVNVSFEMFETGKE